MGEGIGHKRLIITAVLLAVVLLTVIQFLTYWLFAEASMPLVGIKLWFHGQSDKKMQFVCVDKDSWNSLTDSQKLRLDKVLKRRSTTVFYSKSDIPDEMLYSIPLTDDDRKRLEDYLLRGNLPEDSIFESTRAIKRQLDTGRLYTRYDKGILVWWRVISSGSFWMRSSSGCSGGLDDFEDIEADYAWILGFWVKIHLRHHGIT